MYPNVTHAQLMEAAENEDEKLEGVFIVLSESYVRKRPYLVHFFYAADVLFTYFVGLYLITLYFTLMTHTIYKNTNEFMGNEDFYVAQKPRAFPATP